MKTKGWALVTGAASGIGAELCRLLARDGFNIVLVDKNQSGLATMCAELAHGFSVRTVSLVSDLSLPESAQEIYRDIQARNIAIEILVNNAGFGTYGNFWEIDAARDKALINVNIMAPMLLTKYFLPEMVAKHRGRILNVGSVSGFLASPYASTYYSSKAFLLSFSQGIATSLKGSGVTMTIVCPGPTYTAFDWHSTSQGATAAPKKKFQMAASEVAAQAYRGMKRGQTIIIPGASNKALGVLAKVLPRRLALRLLTIGQSKAN